MWIAQVLIAIFFTSGFIRHYQNIYRNAFVIPDYKHKMAARIALMVLSIGIGMMLHLMGYVVGKNAVMFHNLGLFLLLFPLLDDDISIWELLIRIAGLDVVWVMHHNMHYDRPQFWISIVLLTIGVLAMRKWPDYIRNHLWASMATFTYAALIFWLLLPPFADPADQVAVTVRSILMFIAIGSMAAYLWIREHQRAKKNETLRQLANYDQLTNAKTYSLYQHDVTSMFERTRAAGQPLTLVALDIDHFKQINDHYGHLAGNAVLIGVATTLSDVLGKYGDSHQIYRTGGEEFNIAFPDRKPDEVLPVITECWNAVRKEHYKYEDFDVAITLSMGITAVRDTDRTIDDTYKRADDNLYLSKRAGRDTITVEGETVQTRADHDLIATYTYFTQGIIDTDDGNRRYRNELLLRMFDHEHDRWILPDMFDISVATQINLMQKAIAVSSTRRLAINLTTEQFADDSVAHALVEFKASEHGPEQLIVEITDVPDVLTTREITAIYRAGNVQINIDDVGSDNSFEVVRDLLPYVDGVKFAMQNLRIGNTQAKMSERIAFWNEIAKDNHLEFILEGVENADEVAWAHDELGITLMQGYFFNKPSLPAM
jgi:diguanylate cyclase (GGDEF)-like protein